MPGNGTGVLLTILGLPNPPTNNASGHISDHNSIRTVLLQHDQILSQSASLLSAIDNATGTGSLVFHNSPQIANPNFLIGASISGSAIATQAWTSACGYTTASTAQTLINKTLTSPTINGGSWTGTMSSSANISGGSITNATISSSSITSSSIDASKNVLINIPASALSIPNGSITNAQLQNSSVTINGTTLALGGSITVSSGTGGGGTASLFFGYGLSASNLSGSQAYYNSSASMNLSTASYIVDTSTVQTLNNKTFSSPSIVSPITVASAALLSVPVGGAVEYDGRTFYLTPNSNATEGRAVLASSLFTTNTSSVALSNNTSYQSIFASTNNTINLASGMLYSIDMMFSVLSAGTASTNLALTASGVSGSIAYLVEVGQASAVNAIGSVYSTWVSSTGSTVVSQLSPASAAACQNFIVRGTIRTSAAGQFAPMLNYTIAPGAAPTILSGAYARLIPLGSSSTVATSGWT